MDDEQLQQVMGFIKSAVDTAEERFKGYLDQAEERFEERFGKPIMAELHTIRGEVDYLKIKVSGVERDLATTKKMVEDIHEESVKGINTAIGEAFDQGHKAADIFKTMRRTQKDHEKRLTALEQTRG